MKKILCLTILLLLTVNNLVLANRLQYEELQQIDVTGDKLKETINDELIGGIKVIVQNEVIDYTIDSTLTNLKNTIKG